MTMTSFAPVPGQPGLGEDDIFVMKFSTDGVKY